uniref:Uncharacterized protein n=2 Tax=Hemiselmis andersenii TaxID=464988 RepID=A0A6T8MYA4_HEMAN|mmetsp:Transcript_34728/g.81027  ORF Transcript_34728/g.81027 Transcript_34728/m.81027 type:complete len:255 (+) Transcript_34728:59-823(+)|eukprot:CAMPEP_0169435310 /NCGR_PEP_ID=MMETSP1042-20121227/4995_1 /TAXON_ID=464988 /ORGANISM="Hemiselmis andersenii, Strain CCMP1180" /LENGTH=254 /DNA_ID=CAMNT_0009545945 /DNA_START=49 /DNA_END=813 /DNA_ORIENTATION=+
MMVFGRLPVNVLLAMAMVGGVGCSVHDGAANRNWNLPLFAGPSPSLGLRIPHSGHTPGASRRLGVTAHRSLGRGRAGCGVEELRMGMSMGGSFGGREMGGEQGGVEDGEDTAWKSLARVFVLLFNPRTDTEGIYTLQIKRRDDRLVNTIVMFEETEDAERYAGLLEAQDFPPPSVEVIEPAEIIDFATTAGYQTTFIPKGTLFMPPENNVDSSERPWSQEMDGAGSARDQSPAGDSGELDAIRQQLERMYGGTT